MDFVALQESMKTCSKLVQTAMQERLPADYSQSKIVEAMRYSALSQGKRIRPFLLMASANIFDFPFEKCLETACAIEFIHVYSLIHDDLPAMDDDDFRRGEFSNHKKFDEATAILAGDALLTYAFEILSKPETHQDPQIRCEIIAIIAKSAGYNGMVGGQMIDIENIDKKISEEQIFNIHRLKTAELFMASAESGAILGGASAEQRKALRLYAQDLGLAFQIKDDMLDYSENNSDKMKGEISHKKSKDGISVVDIVGIKRSEEMLRDIKNRATKHLKIFNEKSRLLEDLLNFVINRNN